MRSGACVASATMLPGRATGAPFAKRVIGPVEGAWSSRCPRTRVESRRTHWAKRRPEEERSPGNTALAFEVCSPPRRPPKTKRDLARRFLRRTSAGFTPSGSFNAEHCQAMLRKKGRPSVRYCHRASLRSLGAATQGPKGGAIQALEHPHRCAHRVARGEMMPRIFSAGCPASFLATSGRARSPRASSPGAFAVLRCSRGLSLHPQVRPSGCETARRLPNVLRENANERGDSSCDSSSK